MLPLEAKEIDVTDAGAERRRHPRLRKPFPATVRGVDAYGKSFEANTVLDNLSASGLYLQLERFVRQETKLFVIIRLSIARDGRRLRAQVGGLPRWRAGYVVRTLRRVVRHCVRLSREVGLPVPSPVRPGSGPRIAIHGIVVRTEPQPDGRYGIAVKFTHSRFL